MLKISALAVTLILACGMVTAHHENVTFFNSTIESHVGNLYYLSASDQCYDPYVTAENYTDGSGRQIWTFEKLPNANTFKINVKSGDYCYNTTLSTPSYCYDNSVVLKGLNDYSNSSKWLVTPVPNKEGFYTIRQQERYGCDDTLTMNSRGFVELRRNQSGNINQEWYIPDFPTHNQTQKTEEYRLRTVFFNLNTARLLDVTERLLHVYNSTQHFSGINYECTDSLIFEKWNFN